MADKRIIELTEKQAIDSGDFLAVDNGTVGTRKISPDNLMGYTSAIGGELVIREDVTFSDVFNLSISINFNGDSEPDVFSVKVKLGEVVPIAYAGRIIYVGLTSIIATDVQTHVTTTKYNVVYPKGWTYSVSSATLTENTKFMSATLAAGSTTVTFTGIPTTGQNLIELYTDVAGLEYTAVDDTTSGQLTYTFEEQESAVTVYLAIKEVSH